MDQPAIGVCDLSVRKSTWKFELIPRVFIEPEVLGQLMVGVEVDLEDSW